MCPSLCLPHHCCGGLRLCCTDDQAGRGRKPYLRLIGDAGADVEALLERLQILAVGAVLEGGHELLAVPHREHRVRRYERSVVDQYGVAGGPDGRQRRQPLPIDGDGLGPGFPQAVDHTLHVPVAHPPGVGEARRLTWPAAALVGVLRVVDDQLHAGALDRGRSGQQRHQLPLVAAVLLERLALTFAHIGAEFVDIGLQGVRSLRLRVDAVDQLLALLGDDRRGDPRLGGAEGDHEGGHHQSGGQAELRLERTGQPGDPVGPAPRGGLGVPVVEAVVHHVVQQRHGGVGACGRRGGAPIGGLLRHAAHRRTSSRLPPNGPTGAPRPPARGVAAHRRRISLLRCPPPRPTRRAVPGPRRRPGLPPTDG